MKLKEFARHDIPKDVIAVLNAGLLWEVLDMQEIYALGVWFGEDWSDLVDAIQEYAYANIHSPEGREGHAFITEAVDNYHEGIRTRDEKNQREWDKHSLHGRSLG